MRIRFPKLARVIGLCATASLAACGGGSSSTMVPPPATPAFWTQWGMNAQHAAMVNVAGQGLGHQLAGVVYDPFVAQEEAENLPLFGAGVLTAHYEAPLIDDANNIYMISKTGTYNSCNPAGDWINGTACGPNTWNTMVWNEAHLVWQNGQLNPVWTFQTDWKPETNATFGLAGWEPVFHPALANGFLYVPGVGGATWKVNRGTGQAASHITPFGATLDPNTFVAGPLTADPQGNIYYNVLKLADPSVANPWFSSDVLGAWLVKVTPSDAFSTATYAALVPGAPLGTDQTCPGAFFDATTLPWPPSTTAVPPQQVCGSQRPGVNVAPAVAPDGTVFTVSRAHFDSLVSFMVAVNPDLSPKWQASMKVLSDGCGFLVPIATAANPNQPNACRVGTTPGVDPTTNDLAVAQVIDEASSSPTALPDGSVLYGGVTNYNGGRGHLVKFSSAGKFLAAYDFGWDSTPSVYTHNGTYSVVIKDNHYPGGLYCNFNNSTCAPLPPGPYNLTQLSANLTQEWSFTNTNQQSCHRNPDGTITCVNDGTHPNGFEWCINAPVIDVNGVVYVNSEDGNIYTLNQGGTVKGISSCSSPSAPPTRLSRSAPTGKSTPRTTARCSC